MAPVRLSTKAVGSIVKMKVNNVITDFIVIHQGKPSSMYDDSCDGTWLLMKDIYETRQWHSSDVNDYANSTICSYLNSTFLNLFDANLRNFIRQVKIPYRPGSGTSKIVNSGASGLSCKVLLLSLREVGCSSIGNEYVDIGTKLDYFIDGTSSAAGNRRIAYLNGTVDDWWLRSPHAVSSGSAQLINREGQLRDNRCLSLCGARPTLVLPSSAWVLDDSVIAASLPPAISGTNTSVGTFATSPPSYNYTVTDPDNDTVTVVEKLNGTTLTTYTVTLGATNTLTFSADAWRKVLNGNHTLTIAATDPHGGVDTRTLTFVKAVKEIQFTTDPLPADAMPAKAIVNIQGNFPIGSTLTVEICNNGNDTNPAWEDITAKALNNQKHFFANTSKIAAKWAVRLRVKLARGTAGEACYIQSIGGNFT